MLKKHGPLIELLKSAGINPVLIDIGCSGTRFKDWDQIAAASKMIGFDPDNRQIPASLAHLYQEVIIIDRVVCENDSTDEVDFVFTEYPSCSSMLKPNLDALEDYVFRDYFLPQKTALIPATSLNRVIKKYDLETVDWIKIDSQGADLRIIKSLDKEHLDGLVAIDVEPGLIDAYYDEDLFQDVHEFLTNNGFWLTSLKCQSYPRVRRESLNEIANLMEIQSSDIIWQTLGGCPTAAEARYLRTIPCAAACGEKQLILLFVFSLLSGCDGFAYDVSREYAKSYGNNNVKDSMTRYVRSNILESVNNIQKGRGIIRNMLHKAPVVRNIYRKIARFIGI